MTNDGAGSQNEKFRLRFGQAEKCPSMLFHSGMLTDPKDGEPDEKGVGGGEANSESVCGLLSKLRLLSESMSRSG